MATVSQNWAALSSAQPSGTVTIGGGSNRCLILVQTAEFSGSFSASVAIGGQAATGTTARRLQTTAWSHIFFWWWDETALQAMSGNTISYDDESGGGPISLSKTHFSYITVQDVDQTSPVNTAFNTVALSNTIDVGTVSDSNDYAIVAVVRDSANRDITNWDTLSEVWDDGGSFYRSALGSGAGGDNATTVTGDGFDADFLVVSLVIKDESGVGGGDLIVPVPTIDGSGELGVNNLKPVPVQVAGVGERIIYWQGSDSISAPAGIQATNVDKSPIVNPDIALDPVFPRLSGEGQKTITLQSSPTGLLPTVSGSGNKGSIGSGALTGFIGQVASDQDFGAFWYVTKKVYF